MLKMAFTSTVNTSMICLPNYPNIMFGDVSENKQLTVCVYMYKLLSHSTYFPAQSTSNLVLINSFHVYSYVCTKQHAQQ